MKVILENRGRQRVNKGPMRTVFENKRKVILSGIPGSSSSDANFRLLEDGDFRLTENGDFRILE